MRKTLTALFALTLLAVPAQAQNTEIGKRIYGESCAGCHGATGAGDGELAGLLKVNTPDLTGLSARNDGKFPMLDVIHLIDGRTGVRAHGGPMPIFGAVFSASSAAPANDYGTVVEVHGRILSLALYLESMQK
jgi:mono/diheme cytochrome c family protein